MRDFFRRLFSGISARCRSRYQKISAYFPGIQKAASLVFYGLVLAAVLVLVYKVVLEPLSSVITVALVFLFTAITFLHRKTAIMSIVGIALYTISMLTVEAWGVIPAQLIWMVGMGSWIIAVYISALRFEKISRSILVG